MDLEHIILNRKKSAPYLGQHIPTSGNLHPNLGQGILVKGDDAYEFVVKMAFLICFVRFLFLYPDDSWYAECRDICDQTTDAM